MNKGSAASHSAGSTRPGYGGGRPTERTERGTAPTLDVSAVRLGSISKTLYSDVAEACAKEVGKQVGGRESNKGTQLRRFYDELVMLQQKVGSDQAKFEAQAPYIQMLKAKAAYALGRKKIDANFDALVRRVVDQVADAMTLGQAKLFMEAFMAFYKVHGPRD
jgi:CRISPR-associated protein Csm2